MKNEPETSNTQQARTEAPSVWRIGIAAVFLGLALSAAYWYWDTETAPPSHNASAQPPTEAELTLPEDGIHTDAFSVKLLQAALKEEKGNVTVAPSAVTEVILGLQAVDGKSIEETCRQFGLQSQEPSAATLPRHYLQIFVDENQQVGLENRSLMTIPIKRDSVQASAFINRLVLPQDQVTDLVVKASDIDPEDQFITAIDQSFDASWLHPINRQHTTMLPFTTTVGMPDTPTMRVAELYRVAQAPDDTWEAVALLFKRSATAAEDTPEDDWVSLVIVRPKVGTARRMAEKLTAEQVSEIRKALVEAPARPYNLQLPPLRIDVPSTDILPQLQKMGINPQPLSREGDNAGQQARGSVFLQYRIRACESPGQDGKSAVESVEGYPLLRINSSYLWWIGGMTSPAPFLYMGVVEQP